METPKCWENAQFAEYATGNISANSRKLSPSRESIIGQPARSLFHCPVASLGGIGISEDATAVAAICEGCGAFAPCAVICAGVSTDQNVGNLRDINAFLARISPTKIYESSWSDHRLTGYPETSGDIRRHYLVVGSRMKSWNHQAVRIQKTKLTETPEGNSQSRKPFPQNKHNYTSI